MNVLIVAAVLFVFAVGLGFIATIWELREHDERIDAIESDLAVDRSREIETTRVFGWMAQRDQDLLMLELLEGDDPSRLVCGEWTRPDWRDERIPEPHRVTRGIVPW